MCLNGHEDALVKSVEHVHRLMWLYRWLRGGSFLAFLQIFSEYTVLAKSIFMLEVRRTTAQNEQHFCMRQHEHSLVVKLREATTLGWDE